MDPPDDMADATAFPLPNGEQAVLRPIRPDDAPRLQALAPRLSDRTIYYRFFGARRRLHPHEAEHLARVDYHDHMAVVAERATPQGPELIGVVRYERLEAEPHTAEFAIVVEDRFQHEGLGHALLDALTAAARRNGNTRFVGDVLAENQPMLHFIRDAGFPLTVEWRGPEVHFSWDIAASA